jgi:cellulose synthase/poly-beta-1,6-N-acetylglucosamine synthase-like glycosyltransferase
MLKQTIISILHPLYLIISILLGLYSLNFSILTCIFWLRKLQRKEVGNTSFAPPSNANWPMVAVQLPMYNEGQIAVRLIDQVAGFDYPLDCMHIQILDDSTDGTTELIAQRAEYWKSQGRWITLHHRTNRKEYKAGALREAMDQTPADLFAVFDADFLPPADWLKKTVSPFMLPSSEQLGFVQTRWAHLNDRYSLITMAQALFMDAHFGIEQPISTSLGFFNYLNGTGFILRRACVLEAGNWCGDTLVEDMDLCIRAQIAGWKGIFLRDVSAPAELPALISAYKSQQYRWAKGSIQSIRRLTGKILRSKLPIATRMEGLVHIFSYLIHPLIFLLLILALPLYLWSNDWLVKLPIRSLSIIGLSMPFYYFSAHLVLYPPRRWPEILLRLPALSLLSLGVLVNNTFALIDGMGKGPVVFERTPKLGILQHDRPNLKSVKIPLKVSKSMWVEIVLAIYAVWASIITMQGGNIIAAYFFSMYSLGLGWIAGVEIIENIAVARNTRHS